MTASRDYPGKRLEMLSVQFGAYAEGFMFPHSEKEKHECERGMYRTERKIARIKRITAGESHISDK